MSETHDRANDSAGPWVLGRFHGSDIDIEATQNPALYGTIATVHIYGPIPDGRIPNANAKLIASAPTMRKALEDIATGMIPTDQLNAIMAKMDRGDLAGARGDMYGWCQARAKAALGGK